MGPEYLMSFQVQGHETPEIAVVVGWGTRAEVDVDSALGRLGGAAGRIGEVGTVLENGNVKHTRIRVDGGGLPVAGPDAVRADDLGLAGFGLDGRIDGLLAGPRIHPADDILYAQILGKDKSAGPGVQDIKEGRLAAG